MFRASICPSSGVQVVCYCIWRSALGVVAVVLRSRCVVLCTVCKFVSLLVPLVIFIYDALSHIHQMTINVFLHVKYTLFFSDINETWIFSDRCSKNIQILNFIKNPSVGSRVVPCGRRDRRTKRPNEANSRFSHVCELA